MKRDIVTGFVCFLLIFLFTYAGVSKLADHTIFRVQLTGLAFIKQAAPVLSFVLPLFEIVIALLLLVPGWRIYGLYASFILLVLFTGYLVWMVIFETNLPCSCGGIITKLSWQQHILFNLFFIILSIVGISLDKKINKQPAAQLNTLLQ